MHPKNISILDFTYDLPAEKIALRPIAERDASHLLIYRKGHIEVDVYKNLANYLPEKSLLIFNNTKVINARIQFVKPTGGVIEIFCLEPLDEYSLAMSKKKSARWKCLIGGAGKWKDGVLQRELGMDDGALRIMAKRIEKLSDAYLVEFSWEPADCTFAAIIEIMGDIPLPPYIKRKTELSDRERYQTVYADRDGSVAAPTAGLHFTTEMFDVLNEKKIEKDFVTLQVGAGTFKPVKAAKMEAHEMHAEWIEVSAGTIKNILHKLDDAIVAVGTTSLRTLESLYWLGVKTMLYPTLNKLQLTQWEVYDAPLNEKNVSVYEALNALLGWLAKNKLDKIVASTQIIIAPGYVFKVAKALITNFHQPQSTLLLLVAAAIGDDWKKVYEYALQNDFRFLSYGDGSLLFI